MKEQDITATLRQRSSEQAARGNRLLTVSIFLLQVHSIGSNMRESVCNKVQGGSCQQF